MGQLKYRTRGNSSPQGKPRVYFTSHPEESERYFNQVADWVLSYQNCAVWYGEGDEDELRQMQLLVMPITNKLLTTANIALDRHFRLAVEWHIPVLPLMMERGLETLFNAKCGDLQFLDPYASDVTTLSFDEKLKQFLERVLVGDSLAENIRGAFDAYVFLSYRKKDRKYAQRLMRLIHRNNFFRDIAIWYDEFLIPGENFNDAIQGALEKSALFVLAVTPNLVNEENYVMTTEYPMAKEAGKPILPAEVVQTDRKALELHYADIPPCADAYDELLLASALMTVLQGVAIRKNGDDPRHNFLIGLAYLGGVDVEVDHDWAVKLITCAAEAGLIEAVDKLVDMYTTGMGVARNYETAALWRERKCALWERVYEENNSLEDLIDLYQAFIQCGDAYREMGRLERAEYWQQKGLEFLQASVWREDNGVRVDLAAGYERLGSICMDRGDLDKAAAWYDKGLDISLALVQQNSTLGDYRLLIVFTVRLGLVSRMKGDVAKAKFWYESGHTLVQDILAQFGQLEERQSLSVVCCELGDLSREEDDWPGAKAWYEKALPIEEALAEELGTLASRQSLANTLRKLGDVCWHLHEPSARSWYERALAMDEALAEELETVDVRLGLAQSWLKVGAIRHEAGDMLGAKAGYEKAVAISEALAEDAEIVDVKSCLASSYFNLGMLYAEGERRRVLLRRAVEIQRKLCEQCPEVERYRVKLGIMEQELRASMLAHLKHLTHRDE